MTSARAQTKGWSGIGFGTRFFIALALGLIWVVPAAWSPRLIAGMFVWDGVFLLLWVWDLVRLPKPGDLEVSRVWHSPPSLSVASSVSLELHNHGRRAVKARVTDETPRALRLEPPTVDFLAAPGRTAPRRVRDPASAAWRHAAGKIVSSLSEYVGPRRALGHRRHVSNSPRPPQSGSGQAADSVSDSNASGGPGKAAQTPARTWAAISKACANTAMAMNFAISAGRRRRAARNSSRAFSRSSAANRSGSSSMRAGCCARRLCKPELRCGYPSWTMRWMRRSRLRRSPCIPAIASACLPTAVRSSKI